MSWARDLKNNVGTMLIDKKPASSSNSNQEVAVTSLPWGSNNDVQEKQAIFVNWFFSARLGQPRGVDTRKIRSLCKSAWVQMVLNTFKKQIYTTNWEIVKIDPEDETDYTEQIKTVTDFLKRMNDNGDTIDDLNSEVVTDIGEIDAGVWNFVYSADSYDIGDIPVYDAWGRVQSTETGLVLKEFGQRQLVSVKGIDGSTMLKQIGIYKNMLNYWQYSFKHPKQNPTRFEKDEIVYMMMNKKPYSVYGFSPAESVQQILELLIQGTRYNKDLYTNNAIPDILVGLPQIDPATLKKLKRDWNHSYKGKPHQVGFINWAIDKIHKLTDSNRDLEWLDGQKWYFKIIFGVYGVSPTEAGFFENSNKSNDDGQERVTVRNALEPYYKLLENATNSRLIPELLQDAKPGIMFKYLPVDKESNKTEFEQNMQELDKGVITINEYRRTKGKDDVEWGDEPYEKKISNPFGDSGSFGNNPSNPVEEEEQDKVYSEKDFVIDAGDDIVKESKSYSEFITKVFKKFEKRTLSAVDSMNLEKSLNKNFGSFIANMFNAVNTTAFLKHVKKFVKIDMVKGMVSAENELDIDVGWNDNYEQKLEVLYNNQIDGYTINGKKWFGIKGVSKEIQAKTIKVVQDGIQENKSSKEIKEELSKTFDVYTDSRSQMIARTETNRITNESKLLTYKESGLEGKKVWDAALDNRTSDICMRLDKQEQDLDKPFIDPETNKAYMTPPSHCNCRSIIFFRPY